MHRHGKNFGMIGGMFAGTECLLGNYIILYGIIYTVVSGLIGPPLDTRFSPNLDYKNFVSKIRGQAIKMELFSIFFLVTILIFNFFLEQLSRVNTFI